MQKSIKLIHTKHKVTVAATVALLAFHLCSGLVPQRHMA